MHFFPTLCFVLHFLQRDLWTSFVVVQLCKIRSIFQIELRKNSNGMMVSFLLFSKRTWQEVYEWDCCYFEIKRYLRKSIRLYIWYENVYSDPNQGSTFKNVSKNYKFCNFVDYGKGISIKSVTCVVFTQRNEIQCYDSGLWSSFPRNQLTPVDPSVNTKLPISRKRFVKI